MSHLISLKQMPRCPHRKLEWI
uniref:Uncharacterized protein n=1 Tax=Arundo donax TaxID=35708 RepID=A0A0A8XTK2_ARUDO